MQNAWMVELVDTLVLEASAEKRESSSLSSGTKNVLEFYNFNTFFIFKVMNFFNILQE
jgi:hypothetical protein